MTMKERSAVATVISLACLAAIILSGAVPALADNATASPPPYTTTWGNSAGRTGCNATGWGKSDTTMGCSGINSISKCFQLPCKFCRR
jgi:hypothetical protein